MTLRTNPSHAAGIVLALFVTTCYAQDWPRWRGPQGNGYWSEAPQLKTEWPEKLPTLWKVAIGPGYSGISVANGRVYTMDRIAETEQERVLCVDQKSGELLWEHTYKAAYGDLDYGKGPRATPTIYKGRVYTLGSVGHLRCIDAQSGRLIWEKDLQRTAKAKIPTWGFAASPVVYEGQLIVHAGLPGGCYASLDPATGKENWRAGDDPAGYGTPILVKQGKNRILVGWNPEHVVGISMTGKLLWSIPYKVTYGVSMATPLYLDRLIVVSGYWEGTKAIRLSDDLSSAELAWEENRYLRGVMAQALGAGKAGFLLDKRHGLVCFEAATGDRLWSDDNQLTPRERNPHATMVRLGDSSEVLALTAKGELVYATISTKGYKELARSACIGETWAHPAYAGNAVFARDDEKLVCRALPIAGR